MVTADHGPAVSGAHNTIVCARAGKDLVSSLVSGLLTIVRTKAHSLSQQSLSLFFINNRFSQVENFLKRELLPCVSNSQ